MNKTIRLISWLSLSGLISFTPAFAEDAGPIAVDDGEKITEKAGKVEVDVFSQLKVDMEDPSAHETLIKSGHGLRLKFGMQSYIVRSYLPKDIQLAQGEDLTKLPAGLEKAQVKALRLNIVAKSLPAATLRGSFTEALAKNRIYLEKTTIEEKDGTKTEYEADLDVKTLFDQLDFSADLGNTIDFVSVTTGTGDDAIDQVVIRVTKPEAKDCKTLKGHGKNLGLKFWSIWFGAPVDKNMAGVKAKLIGEKK